MSYDLYAVLSAWDRTQSESFAAASPDSRRWQCALTVFGGVSDEEKNRAKRVAADSCSRQSRWQRDFPEILPGTETPFLSCGLGIEITWILKTPFFSRSESEFEALDNPLSRDAISGLPVLRASGAKGMLRQIVAAENRELAERLFGRRLDGDEDAGSAGSVVFGDVVFQDAASDVFSPHDHHFGVVDHPIFFEVVRAGSRARWGMLMTALENESCREETVILLEAVAALLYDYGLSAKRSSGYGIAEPGAKVRLRPGRRVVLPEKYLYREGASFAEPRPREAVETIAEPEFFSLLSDGQRMLVEREQTLDALIRNEFPRKDKKDKKMARKKDAFRKKWQKKDAAGKLWDRCEKYIVQRRNHDPEAESRLREALAAWEKRREEHEAGRRSYYEFGSLESAIEILRQDLTINP